MPLTVISSVNNEGKNVILGYALVERETNETYKWLMAKLIELSDGVEPAVIHTDFDPAMCHGIEKTFNKTLHLLCQWHMKQNFKKNFLELKSMKSFEARELRHAIISLIFTDSMKEWQHATEMIFSSTLILSLIHI